MNPVVEGLTALLDPTALLGMALGIGLGMLVGAFPGITATMAVALASGFTLTLSPVQGLAVLLSIYTGANFGDRIPAILVNTPGTPAAIGTTFDGYPLAKQGKAGLALVVSGFAAAIGILLSMIVFSVAAVPIASFALNFGPYEFFALVVLGLTVMISISSKSLVKGLIAGLFGLFLATIGHDPMTADPRFTFGFEVLSDKLDFIAVVIGLFGVAEVFDQMLTHSKLRLKPVASLGRWWPNKKEYREMGKPLAIGTIIGTIVGIVPAAGGDIAGLIGWDRAKAMSKHPEKYGKGSLEGLVAADSASTSTLGGALTTTMALGIPGDSVNAVMLGSMLIWGLQPGPQLFANNPALVASIAGIMVISTIVSLGLNLFRIRGLVKILDMPMNYLWASVIILCVIGTYATTNDINTVVVMLCAGAVGVLMKRTGFPAGPVVLGLLLGPLAESNLRRALIIGGPEGFLTNPIATVLLAFAILAFGGTLYSHIRAGRKESAAKAAAAAMAQETTTPKPEGR
ncbi:MAG: tripartite tricarboxylate transporter permease [Microbacteriaceae bacterium]